MPRRKKSESEASLASEVGDRIRQIRESKNLSQRALADRLGKGTQRALANYEAGEALIPSDLARGLCAEFDVNFDWLMTGQGPQKQSEVIGEAQSRRAEEEAYRVLKAVREVAGKHAHKSGDPYDKPGHDPFSTALRLSLSRLEREFATRRGASQFAGFLEDFIVTARDLLKKELEAIDEARWDKLDRASDDLHGPSAMRTNGGRKPATRVPTTPSRKAVARSRRLRGSR